MDALTGALRREFVYDASGRLSQVIEKTGGTDNVTTIERDAGGNPTAIVGPLGKRTTMTVDANGSLVSLTNPAGETTTFTSGATGLLTARRHRATAPAHSATMQPDASAVMPMRPTARKP